MVANFCGSCGSATQGIETQRVCTNCGRTLDIKVTPDPTEKDITPPPNPFQRGLSGEGSLNEPFEFDDSPASSQKTLVTTTRRFEKLSGDGEIARQKSIDKTTDKAVATTISHAGGTTNALNMTKKPVSGKNSVSVARTKSSGTSGKSAIMDNVSCTVQLQCGYFAQGKENEPHRVEFWRPEERRVAVSLPNIPFDYLSEYLEEYVLDALPESFLSAKMRLQRHSWFPALEVHRKDGPLQLARNGKDLRHAKDFIKLLYSSTGPKGSKRLHICWEEMDPALNVHKETDSETEDKPTPAPKRVKRSGTTRTDNRLGGKGGIKDKIIKQEPGVKQEPGIKQELGIKQEPGIKQEQGTKQEPECKIEMKIRKRNNDGSAPPDQSASAKVTVSESFMLSADEGIAEAQAGIERGATDRVVTRRGKQVGND